MAPVADEPAWDQGIRNHLVYLARTPARYLVGNYRDLHTENPASPLLHAFRGQKAASSNLFYGQPGFSPRDFIDGWLSGPFHAVGILRPQLKLVAFAYDAATGSAGLDVISGLDYAQARPSNAVVFPGPGAPTELSAFRGESPDPRQSCGWQALAESVGLPFVVLLPSPPEASLTAVVARPGGVVETGANGGLCIVDSHTSRARRPGVRRQARTSSGAKWCSRCRGHSPRPLPSPPQPAGAACRVMDVHQRRTRDIIRLLG